MATSPTPAPAATRAPKPYPDHYDDIAAYLRPHLAPEEDARFQEKVSASHAAIRAFEASEEGQELAALQARQFEAFRARDTERYEALLREAAPLQRKHYVIWRAGRAAGREALSEENLIRYDAWALANSAIESIGTRVTLDAAQVHRAQRIAEEMIQPLVAKQKARGADHPWKSDILVLFSPVHKRIVAEVLTDAQRERLQRRRPSGGQ